MLDQATILGIVRHVLTFGGGYLVSKGLIDSSGLETSVAALSTLIGVAWSAYDKYAAKKAA